MKIRTKSEKGGQVINKESFDVDDCTRDFLLEQILSLLVVQVLMVKIIGGMSLMRKEMSIWLILVAIR